MPSLSKFSLYKNIVRPLLFSLPSETAHDLSLSMAEVVQSVGLENLWKTFLASDVPNLECVVAGIKFRNPIGLAAGFDKNCRIVPFLAALGFGHIEIGSVTAQAQAGNPKPRIFRLPADNALINRMGFPSEGAELVARRLRRLRASYNNLPVLGVNLGKTKVVPIDAAVADYQQAFAYFADLADYFVLNVSSPNTPDLRKLQEPARLLELFQGIKQVNIKGSPLLVKVAPDLTLAELDSVLQVCAEAGIQGIIATNTTFDRSGLTSKIEETGGLSGAPLFKRAVEVVRFIATRTENKLPIIAAGGVASGQQADQFLQAGAKLVQLYTGLVYEGPLLVKQINQYLQNNLPQ